MAGRDRPELSGLIGYFVNLVALRLSVPGEPTFRELLAAIRDDVLADLAHQDTPFELVVDRVLTARPLDRTPLVQVAFEMHQHSAGELRLGEIAAVRRLVPTGTAKFDLMWQITEESARVHGVVEYRTALFDESTVAALLADWIDVLRTAVPAPDQPVAALLPVSPVFVPGQRVGPLSAASDSSLPARSSAAGPIGGHVVHELFAEQVRRSPDEPALCEPGIAELTYTQLDAEANRLANALVELGVRRGDLVGLRLGRSARYVVAMLGVLKAGAAYVPMDGSLPAERLALIAGETNPRVVVTEGTERWQVTSATELSLDRDAAMIAARSAVAPEVDSDPEDLFYLPYTSGSTGRPKGTLVPHRAIPGFFTGVDYATWGPGSVTLMHSALSWDMHLIDVFPALLSGGRVVVHTGPAGDPLAVVESARRHRVTVLFLATAAFNAVAELAPESLRDLPVVVVAGEALPVRTVAAALRAAPETRLVNGYGPSECTAFVTARVVTEADVAEGTIPIGREIGDRRVYLLNERGRPAAPGEVGEICVGGPAVAAGYLDRPEQTAARFEPDPAGTGLLYHTGDLGRRNATGDLEYLGRTDDQVKIRGFRVEPGEVEAALRTHPAVTAAAVGSDVDSSGNRRLNAYLVLNGEPAPSVAQLRAHLSGLPGYLIPARFLRVESISLTHNGKVDRRTLPDPDTCPALELATATPGTAERGAVELVIGTAWALALGVSAVDPSQDLFEIGAHSLNALRARARIGVALRVDVPVPVLFRCRTVAGLAAEIESGLTDPVPVRTRATAISALPDLPDADWIRMVTELNVEES